jgi:hypothetical protein
MDVLLNALRDNPELAIFLTLAAGFVIGRSRAVIQAGERRRDARRGRAHRTARDRGRSTVSRSAALFLFATGYKWGPNFLGPKKVRSPRSLTVVLCVTACHTVVAARLLGYDSDGGASAGAFAESPSSARRYDRPTRLPGERTSRRTTSPWRSRQLPGRHRLRRLVSLGPGSPSAASGPEGREPETGGPRVVGGSGIGSECAHGVQGMERPCVPAGRGLHETVRGGPRALREPRAGLRGTHPARRRPHRCHA